MTNVSTMANRSEFSKILIITLPTTNSLSLKIGRAPNGKDRFPEMVDVHLLQGAQALQNSLAELPKSFFFAEKKNKAQRRQRCNSAAFQEDPQPIA